MARFWLDSDRGGLHAVEVSLTGFCRITGAVDVTNSTSEGGVRVYLDEFDLHPFSANKYFVFPGGCVTYRYRFGPDAEPTLALEADEAVTFGLRTVLVRQVQEELGTHPVRGGRTPVRERRLACSPTTDERSAGRWSCSARWCSSSRRWDDIPRCSPRRPRSRSSASSTSRCSTGWTTSATRSLTFLARFLNVLGAAS